jgi:AraC family transcriptional activator of pobA
VQAVLDERRSEGQGPLAIAIPPAVAHAFHCSPQTKGVVLTLDARRLAEGEHNGVGAALQTLFAAARVLPVPAHEADRLQTLFAAVQA